jgi:hypothetical protein
LLVGIASRPRAWNSKSSTIHKPTLPIDNLARLLGEFHPPQPQYQPPQPFPLPHEITKREIKEKSMILWQQLYPPPEYYDFPFSTSPHPFMSFDKFISGRFHQFRVLKSYLTAHQSWHNANLSQRCPRCGEDDEDLHHALLVCPARDSAREEFIPDLNSVADIWSSPSLLTKVVQYLRATKTGYPPAVSGWFPTSPTTASDCLSEVESISSMVFSLLVI